MLLTAATALVLVAVAAVLAVRVATAPHDRVPAGVRIGGVAVGGLTSAEAERAVIANAPPPPPAVRLALAGVAGFPLEVPVARLEPRPRVRLAVRQALRPRAPSGRLLRELGLGEERRVPLRYRLTPSAVRRTVAGVADRVDRPPRPAAVRVAGGRVTLARSRPGRRVDRSELARRLARLPRALAVPVATVPPAVTDAEGERALRRAALITRAAVTVRGAGRSAAVERAVLLRALRVTPEGSALRVRLHGPTLAAAVRPAFAALLAPPRPARFAVRGDRVEVVPSRDGRRLDGERIAAAILRRAGARTVPVRLASLRPRLTTAAAMRLRIRELVAEFATPYACCQPRVVNIRRAAQILDGQVVAPGASFSLNEALGERTTARGFVPAPQINAGRLEDAVGGGVSQVATTMFNAAFFAGLRIVTHTPHEFWISRYPPGREATISWGGPELVVENDWPAGVLIGVRATDEGITVRLYSSRLGRRVRTETTGTPREGAAFSVAYTRKVWRRDELRRDERYTWSYRAPPAE